MTKTFRFERDELGLLVDFIELFKRRAQTDRNPGMPRVGKTESIVASSVCASKRWLFVSSTLLKQTIRSQLVADEYSTENVFILDGIVSTRRGSERHLQLVSEIMRLPATKVVEHPDILFKIRSIRSMISIILSNSEMILTKSLHMNMQKNRKCLIRPVFKL